MRISCPNVDTTRRLAHLLGNQLNKTKGGNVVVLEGTVGTGKSEFARAMLRSVCKDPFLSVTSPTFVLCNTYHRGKHAVHHLDLYRLTDVRDLSVLNLEALREQGDDLVVEWPRL